MAKNFNEPEDLLSDESFLAWYFKMPGKEQQEWDSWMSGHPEQTQLVQQAISLLEATRLEELPVPLQQIATAEKRLFDQIAIMPGETVSAVGSPVIPGPADMGSARVLPLFNRRRL